MGMFKRRKSKTDTSDSGSSAQPSPNGSTTSYPAYSNYEQQQQQQQQSSSPARSTASAPAINGNGNGSGNGNGKKNKKGIGSKLKGLVRVSSSKKFAGDSKSVGSTSSQEQNFNDPPKLQMKNQRVVPRKQLQNPYESSSSFSSSEDEDQFHQELGTVTEVNEDDYNSDGELRPKSMKRLGHTSAAASHAASHASSHASSGTANGGTNNSQKKKNNKTKNKKTNDFPVAAATLGGEDADENTIALVVLLVDPNTNRFEFLHLERKKSKSLKVKNIMSQFKTCVTEASLKKLQIEGLVDRLGQVHKPNALLSNAMGSHPTNKDILVGLVQGVSVDQLLLTLVTNGFDTKGWVKKKKTKDSILDKKPPPMKVEQQGGVLSIIAFTICIIGILAGVDTCLMYLNQKGSFVRPLIYWPHVMESAGDFALQGAQAAKEAILQGNSTAALAMVNSTIAAVEETALEAVSDVKELVPNMMMIGTSSTTKSMSKSSSPKAVLDTAKTIAKMAGVSSSSSSSPKDMLDTAKNVAKMAAASYSTSSSMMSSPSSPKAIFNTAKNMMGGFGVPNTKVVSETTTTSSSIMTNLSNAIANVTNGLIANATPTKTATGNTTTSTPNAVWEDYVLIGLLVCWFLYWMAI
ncbi:MAG: hypothetical protein SGBAC_011285 [Bacillariaceae sp.]